MRSSLVTMVMLLVASAAAHATVDPFYATRAEEGIAAYDRHNYADAVQSLRIACFGMLDDEAQLSDCLVRLALAQAGANDRDGFAQTFNRLVEGERLVGLYSRHLPARELTGPFEAKVVEWIPRTTLIAVPVFARLGADAREAQLAALAPKARRERLLQLQKQEPKDVRWPLLQARLEQEQGDAKAALGAADRTLKLDPEQRDAHCVRGWALGALGRAQDAKADVEVCPQAIGAAPAPAPAAPPRAASGAPTTATPAAPVATAPRTPSAPAAAPSPAPAGAAPTATSLPASDAELLARAQSLLANAHTAADLEQAYTAAAGLAGRYPHDRTVQHTAAEIAYRASRWNEAVRFFRQGGEPGEDRPLLLFYYAVSLWESGARQEAAVAMKRCDGKLRSTPFVESYRAKILGNG